MRRSVRRATRDRGQCPHQEPRQSEVCLAQRLGRCVPDAAAHWCGAFNLGIGEKSWLELARTLGAISRAACPMRWRNHTRGWSPSSAPTMSSKRRGWCDAEGAGSRRRLRPLEALRSRHWQTGCTGVPTRTSPSSAGNRRNSRRPSAPSAGRTHGWPCRRWRLSRRSWGWKAQLTSRDVLHRPCFSERRSCLSGPIPICALATTGRRVQDAARTQRCGSVSHRSPDGILNRLCP